ncbi:SHOCT domain-containing protein [Maridesulfovibrio frigidus]|uniref:SHOCT domain-containing protein n=1 Tax=Maridesulfovibrio frigidus TaxID=340956 RepID=UPI0004E16CBF|nr:SHOCT domain-containing protein [Maridesulfovibrio frigidus]
MKLVKLLGLIVSIALAGVLMLGPMTGCGGGGADQSMQTKTTTTGQELQDLDAAYKKGVITEDEYKDQKEKILDD